MRRSFRRTTFLDMCRATNFVEVLQTSSFLTLWFVAELALDGSVDCFNFLVFAKSRLDLLFQFDHLLSGLRYFGLELLFRAVGVFHEFGDFGDVFGLCVFQGCSKVAQLLLALCLQFLHLYNMLATALASYLC